MLPTFPSKKSIVRGAGSRLLALLALLWHHLSITEAAVAFDFCEDAPCVVSFSKPCSHYVDRSYKFHGNCCSLSAPDNDSCQLTVSNGTCTFYEGEPGTALSCEREETGETIDCFLHDHELLLDVCRDYENDSIIYDITNFTSCSGNPSFTEVSIISTFDGTCPESAFPLRANTTWMPSSPEQGIEVDNPRLPLETQSEMVSSGERARHATVWCKGVLIVLVFGLWVENS